MTNDEKRAAAQRTFGTLCSMLDNKNWSYKKNEEDLTITCTARGDDLPMELIIRVDEMRSLVSLLSYMPFRIKEEKRIDAAIALTIVNYKLVDGSFDFDLHDGTVIFRLTNSFRGSDLGEDVFEYMVLVSCQTIDDYNDKLLMLSLGNLDIDAFDK